jgi:hypothetical protein
MRLSGGQAEPDREALRVDDDVDLGREPAARSTETMICTPLFAVAACWCARMEVLSIIWIWPSCAALTGVHQPVPHACLAPPIEAIVAGGARAVALG